MVRLILLSLQAHRMCPQKKIPPISLIYTEAICANQCQSVGNFIPTNYELKKSFLHLDD